jgi:signal transduction histidine kinase
LLTVVVGEADLLAGEPLSEAGRSSVVNIATASRDGCNVISRLQSTVRGLPMDEVESLDLHAILTEVLLVSRVRIAANNDTGPIRVTLMGTPGHYVRGVASELREVFSNLVTNAIDAMPNGGALAVSIERDTELAVVSLRDTGSGMTEEVKARALEPFFSTKGSRGNGLGLAIVQGVLTKHGGSLSIDSVVGAGSTFRVKLPVVAAAVGSTRWLENTSLMSRSDTHDPADERAVE